MRKLTASGVAALVLAMAWPAAAQDLNEKEKANPTAARSIVEVEKDWYFESEFGFVYPLGSDQFANGFMTDINFGYDATYWFAFDAGLMVMALSSGGPKIEDPDPAVVANLPEDERNRDDLKKVGAPGDDQMAWIPNANVKLSFVSSDHVYLYLRLGGGLVFNEEAELTPAGGQSGQTVSQDPTEATKETAYGKSIPMFQGALGVEYYTDLRHFSIGIEPRGIFVMAKDKMQTFVCLVPTAKYTF